MTGKGFIAGYEDDTFHPNETITYQEMVTILSSVAAWMTMDGYALSQKDLSIHEFAALLDLPDWVQIPVRNLTELGFALDLTQPGAPADRAQAADLLYQLMDVTNLFWGNDSQEHE